MGIMARSGVLIALCGAALFHLALDFPLHNDDARAHFWPVTNWKFISPVSYWDPKHFGHIVGPIEVGMVIAASIYIWRKFTGFAIRGLTAVPLADKVHQTANNTFIRVNTSTRQNLAAVAGPCPTRDLWCMGVSGSAPR